jgi:hypothetical protein
MFVLIMRAIYIVRRLDGLSCMILLPSFRPIGSNINVRLLPQQSDRLQCWYYWLEGLQKYAIEMASCGMVYIPRFMKINAGLQTWLRFCLRSLRGWNVGITDGSYLWNTPLRWVQEPWYTYQVSYKVIQEIKSCSGGYSHTRHKQQNDLISLLLLFQNNGSRLKKLDDA